MVLIIISPSDIETKGIPYVRFKMEEPIHTKRSYDDFWNYFIKTWMHKYDVRSWNMNHLIEIENLTGEQILINKTNNALENHNKHLNK